MNFKKTLKERTMKKFMLLILTTLFYLPLSIAQQASIWDQIPEEKKTNAFRRFEYIYKQIAYPYDTIPMHKYATELENEIQRIRTQQRKTDSELEWDFVGPTGIENIPICSHWGVSSGRIRSVAVHPSDPLTVYIGVGYGGIWKTTNGGESWTDIGDYNTEVLTFGSIAIDPNNPDIVYAGTGEVYGFSNSVNYGKGLFKSTDAGVNWTKATVELGDITFFGDLVVSPHNSNILYAALAGGYLLINQNQSNEGLWKSADAGSTWTKTLDCQDAYDIVVHPTNPDTVYAATGGWFTTSGFYISTDAGDTWVQSDNTGLPPQTNIGRMQIDIAKSSPNILYAIIYDGMDNTPKAYKTTNSGENWTHISPGVMLSGYWADENEWYDQGDYDLCIAVNPSDPDHVLIGNVELHETTNGSDFSVRRIPGGNDIYESVVHIDYHHLVFAPSDPNIFFIGCDGGIYKSTDAGITFLNLNNDIRTIEFWRIASHPTNENLILGGAQDNWTSISFNGLVDDWVAVTGGDGFDGFFDYVYPDSIVYASNQYGGLKKSINGGHSFWTMKEIGGFLITPFFMHPTDHLKLYSANNDIWHSTDGGSTWAVICAGVTQDYVFTMAQSKVNPDNMILAGGGSFPIPNNPEVKISTNGGEHWSNDLSANIPGETRWITKVVTHPAESNTMYIVRSGLSENNKIYKTTDLGNTWANISGDLPNLPCWDFFVHHYIIEADTVNNLFVGTDIGVYTSTNDGINWQYASEDIPFMPVMDFDNAYYGKLRVGTNGRSAYETELPFLQLPTAPILIEPVNNAELSSDTVKFVWHKSYAEVTNYLFELDTTDQFSAPVFSDSTITDTTLLYTSLSLNEKYWWRVKALNSIGWGNFSEVRTFNTIVTNLEDKNQLPIVFSLEQNYPNPFNPVTMIRYSVPERSNVSLKIFNPLGEEIEILIEESKETGTYEVVWNAEELPSGVYFYKIQAGDYVDTKKMVLLK
jgi:photosystem II stability/assembly factor-like uncharacterized protein